MNTMSATNPQLLVTVEDAALLNKIKNAIKMLNGVGSISVLNPKKTDIEKAHDDVAAGRVTSWSSVDELFDTVLAK